MINQKAYLSILLAFCLLLIANTGFSQAIIEGKVQMPEGYKDTVYLMEMESIRNIMGGSSRLLKDQTPVDGEGRFSFNIPEENLTYDTTFYRLHIVPENLPSIYYWQFSGNYLYVALHAQSRIKVQGRSNEEGYRPTNGIPRGLVKVTEGEPMFWEIVEADRQNMAIQHYIDQLEVLLTDTFNIMSFEGVKARYPDKDSMEVMQQLQSYGSNIFAWYVEEKLIPYLDTAGNFYAAIHPLYKYSEWVMGMKQISNMPFMEMKYPIEYHLGNAKKYLNNWAHYTGNPYFDETKKLVEKAWDDITIDQPKLKVDPDLQLPGLEEGEALQLVPDDKKLVLVDFFASWCAPCVSDHKNVLPRIYEDYHEKGLSILTLSVDRTLSDFNEYQMDNPVHWRETFLHEDKRKEIYNALNANPSVLPYYMLIDQKGNILERGFNLAWFDHIVERHLP